MRAPLKIGIEARLTSGQAGGVEQVAIGLASGLSRLSDGDEEYHFLAHAGRTSWLEPYIEGPARIRITSEVPFESTIKARFKKRVPHIDRVLRDLPPLPGLRHPPPRRSDGTLERAGFDLIHFPIQRAFITELPTIYQPHDLQHVHFPENFGRRERHFRESSYRLHCERARAVVMMTSWGKQDLVKHYKLPGDRVLVVPGGSTVTLYPRPSTARLEATKRHFGLPSSYLLYPANTWPHKNHIGLLRALALLRNKDLIIPVVCCGAHNDHLRQIQREIVSMGLEEQVVIPGFVSPTELSCLHDLARALVFPSRFEGWGLPISDAQALGLPVACSHVPSLREVAGDTALFFDPNDPEDIAEVIRRIWTDETLRDDLVARAKARVRGLSWDVSARIFRAIYRKVGNRELSEEDEQLLMKATGQADE